LLGKEIAVILANLPLCVGPLTCPSPQLVLALHPYSEDKHPQRKLPSRKEIIYICLPFNSGVSEGKRAIFVCHSIQMCLKGRGPDPIKKKSQIKKKKQCSRSWATPLLVQEVDLAEIYTGANACSTSYSFS
jgi:hypothetical protein